MAFTQVSDIQSPTDYVQKVYEDAMFVARENDLMSSLVTNYTGQGIAPRVSSVYNATTISALADSDDLASQSFAPTVLSTLTPSEVGAQYLITDQRMESDPFGVMNAAAQELGYAMATKIETDIISNFTSFTGGTVGAAGSVMTWGRFFAAVAQLRAQKAPGPYYAVLHPYQIHDLASEVALAGTMGNTPTFGDAVMTARFFSQAAGCSIFESSNIAVDASDDAIGGVFSQMALALDIRRAMRVERQRDASRRAEELNLSAVYAHGVWRPKYGVKIISDASIPTV
tara:strand:- start:921 stop:1775 length:855 start_codon:yes stop_codon:yes gene_type:complete